MTSIVGIPSTRVSDIFIRDRLLRQVQYDQGELFKVQMQLATGRKFELPSEAPVASLRIMDLQRLLERKSQIYTNVQTNKSYLTSTDTALMSISDLTSDARGVALSVMGTTSTDQQRLAAAQQIDQILQQMLDTGNQNFRGRYLFAGSLTETQPYVETDQGCIEYVGNELAVRSYSDIDLLFKTNMTGNEVFGGISTAVDGSIDVDPALTYDTPLSDLRGGLGISPGSIKISNGSASSIIDISKAETIGDLAGLLKDNPPTGSQVEVEVTSSRLRIRLTSGDMSITEVAGGTTANELGILRETGVGTAWVNGRDLDPILKKTTRIDETFATPARAVLHSAGIDNDLIFTAGQVGSLYNNVTISFADTAPAKGAETVTWDAANGAMTIGIAAGASDAADVIAIVTTEYAAGNIPFQVELDPLDHPDTGAGFVEVTSAVTANGGGTPLDIASGLQVVNDEETFVISLATAQTYEDILNAFNGSGAGLYAEINETKTGINVHSRVSGSNFAIGENGGTTASQLGLRTLTVDSVVSNFNHGLGIHTFEGGTDFTITRADGVTLDIDVDTAETVQDVLDLINFNVNNADGYLTAQLNTFGNGIELVDGSPGAGPLVITRNPLSTAAYDLGLIPVGVEDKQVQTLRATASGNVPFGGFGANNALDFVALWPGDYGNVQLIFQDTAVPDGAYYDPLANTLTFEITAGVTDANAVMGMVTANPTVNALFAASLDIVTDPLNDGTGMVFDTTANMTGGVSETMAGDDTNPRETEGIFTALLRLRTALETNDVIQMQRSIDLLDDAANTMRFAHAELGAREQGLETLKSRLDEEDVQLQEVLSEEYDVDVVEVVSDMTAKQAAFEASLRSMASIFQLSLLNFL
ncbi:MAG: hypothetical protein JW818_23080 [Pirellulales bacterium]|nr:hypothetical protein [Pirellulales bacterium]